MCKKTFIIDEQLTISKRFRLFDLGKTSYDLDPMLKIISGVLSTIVPYICYNKMSTVFELFHGFILTLKHEIVFKVKVIGEKNVITYLSLVELL